jgi:C1A family cysteine protease
MNLKEYKESKHQYGLGCMPSVMDGTEHIYTYDEKAVLPDEFSWQDSMPPVRNQGLSSTCVCQTLTGIMDFLHNSELGVSGICNNYSINELYAQRADKNANGMTFKDALHYLRHNGLSGQKISSYAKIPSDLAVKHALVMFGPVAGGFPVWSGSNPKFWKKVGRYEGGHAVTIVGYNKEGFIIRNSWGTSWGDKGHVVCSYEDFHDACFEAWCVTF